MAEVLPLKFLVTHLGDGRTTEVLAAVGEQTSSIAAVKERISALDGIEAANQYLFRVHDGDALSDDDLGDDEVLCASCVLYLLVGDTRFKWDSAGFPVAGGIFALVNSKTARRDMWPFYSCVLQSRVQPTMNIMRMLPSMRGVQGDECHDSHSDSDTDTDTDTDSDSDKNSGVCSGGIFTISLKFTINAAAAAAAAATGLPGPYVHCGLVASDLTKKSLPCIEAMMSQWVVTDAPGGAAAAASRAAAFAAGGEDNAFTSIIPHLGSIITIKWDANTCTQQFFMDGKQYYSLVQTFARGIPLQWAVEAPCRGTVIEIVECEDDLMTIKQPSCDFEESGMLPPPLP
jgi:hypothetical protein